MKSKNSTFSYFYGLKLIKPFKICIKMRHILITFNDKIAFDNYRKYHFRYSRMVLD